MSSNAIRQQGEEGRNGVGEGNRVPCGEASAQGTEGRTEHRRLLLREDAGSQHSSSEVPQAAEHEGEAMRKAQKRQEGAFLICDGVIVLSGGTGGLEGHRGDTGNDSAH